MTARFKAGDRVRTRAANPEGHTRLPRYLCDRRGTIETAHDVYPLPDERAKGVSLELCKKEMLYTVVFDGREVWGEQSAEPLSVSADLWDTYLHAEQPT
ncbi:MAG TPA: SH3-like domain-containing protein [Polyangiaceae bacterium]|nr:SH3-like domain-containing protein [Polyangiaceae bacterium]